MFLHISTHPVPGTPQLADLLLACHDRIRHFLRVAATVAATTESPQRTLTAACYRVEQYFTRALPLHIADEERSILPRLRQPTPVVDRALSRMQAQHREHEPQIARLLETLRGMQRGPAHRHRAELARTVRELETQFTEHLALEESMIVPAVRRLPDDIQVDILDELRARRQPPRPLTAKAR